ncbi:OsmC family protein [Stutzerimonas stutzeri]|uniref:OsmC family protein n=1 Tax=Stutzerimonas stutzeri TaxID=316 RepID=UPI000F7B11A6|nr:OsmC family protein [Stutzerimonas stutzeri]MCQ4239208.1 OsmC family protein [Stutzerimonas stutzeri]MCW8159847.1 OsmC family peroxiredoxin [Stutzerimonas stutzeri]MDH0725468.1 OsmC family protein [Stutzerimonas stutzeri]RRV33751.1 OsmC family peroxiredoxin [Stutzerimonas stutzeri]RRV74163.1 OsmC family peroxiredoxin [Stutzerimonas stutzeri]
MAMKTISARGQMNAGMAIEVECGNHRLIMDQPRNAAGQDLGPTPLEAILAAVAGCFGTIGRFIAHQQKIELRGMRFEIEADYDPSGLLGRDPSMRPGIQELRVKVEIDADLDRAGKQALLELIEKRCPVADNLTHGTRLVSMLL